MGNVSDQDSRSDAGRGYERTLASTAILASPAKRPTLLGFLHYHRETGRHLQVYGDIGELFGAIMYGIRLHQNYAQGSDGRVGGDFVDFKTITPFKTNNTVSVRLDRHFSKLLIVRIDEHFQVTGSLIDRKLLPKSKGNRLRVTWDMLNNGHGSPSWQSTGSCRL